MLDSPWGGECQLLLEKVNYFDVLLNCKGFRDTMVDGRDPATKKGEAVKRNVAQRRTETIM
jgi:hypothetical protein